MTHPATDSVEHGATPNPVKGRICPEVFEGKLFVPLFAGEVFCWKGGEKYARKKK